MCVALGVGVVNTPHVVGAATGAKLVVKCALAWDYLQSGFRFDLNDDGRLDRDLYLFLFDNCLFYFDGLDDGLNNGLDDGLFDFDGFDDRLGRPPTSGENHCAHQSHN